MSCWRSLGMAERASPPSCAAKAGAPSTRHTTITALFRIVLLQVFTLLHPPEQTAPFVAKTTLILPLATAWDSPTYVRGSSHPGQTHLIDAPTRYPAQKPPRELIRSARHRAAS